MRSPCVSERPVLEESPQLVRRLNVAVAQAEARAGVLAVGGERGNLMPAALDAKKADAAFTAAPLDKGDLRAVFRMAARQRPRVAGAAAVYPDPVGHGVGNGEETPVQTLGPVEGLNRVGRAGEHHDRNRTRGTTVLALILGHGGDERRRGGDAVGERAGERE